MIELGLNYADSTIEEMTDFIETRVENLEPREDKKKSSAVAKKNSRRSRKESGKNQTPVSLSPVKEY